MSKECTDIIPSLCGKGGVVFPEVNCNPLRIEGVDDVTINQGVGIDLTEGVTAYDKYGNEVPFTVEPSEIAKCDVGEHTVTYTAIGQGDEMLPHIGCGKNRTHISPLCDSLDRATEERIITITQADPPVITASPIEALPNTDINPLEGVSAVDDNGNPVDVTYSGTLDKMASGSIATFPDGTSLFPAKAVKVSLEPIQDLHGYDKPWSGGNGKNKCSVSELTNIGWASSNSDILAVFNSLPVGTYTISFDVTVTSVSKTGEWQDGIVVINPNGNVTRFNNFSNNPTVGFTDTMVYTFTLSDAQIGAFTSCHVYGCGSNAQGEMGKATLSEMQLESGTSKTDFAPYSNICPINGRTEVVTQRTGKNLLDLTVYSGCYYNPTIGSKWTLVKSANQFDGGDGEFTISLEAWASRCFIAPVKIGETYTLSAKFSGDNVATTFGFLDKDYTVLTSYNTTGATVNLTPTRIAQNDGYIYLLFAPRASTQVLTLRNPQLELGSTATAYEPYHGNAYDISWQTEAGTVYGGEVDAVSGVLTVTHASITLDGTQTLGGANWQTKADSTAWWYPYSLTNHAFTTALTNPQPLMSDSEEVISSYAAIYGTKMGVSCYNSSGIGLIVRTSDMSLVTASAVNAYLAQHPIQVVYELATPQTYQLTPTAISLLDGTNNVWSDGGDVEVVYTTPVPESGSIQYPLEGEYEITYTAEDECGNKSELTVPVEITEKRTVLYSDGTLIINERSRDIPANRAEHGTETATYDPLDSTHDYSFGWNGSLWYAQRSNITSVEIGSVIKPTSMNYWFKDLNHCTSIDLTNIDSSDVTKGRWLFYNCSALTSLDVSPLRDAHWGGNFDAVFAECTRLTALDLSGFDIANVTDLSEEFSNCMNLSSLNISSFDTSKVLNMALMFNNCQVLTTLDVSHFNTENVTGMRGMFATMYAVSELDLSSFDTNKVRNMARMLYGNRATTIYVSDKFATDAVTDSTDMFQNANNLVGGAGTSWSSSNPTDKTYAHIDGGTSDPGYFTAK